MERNDYINRLREKLKDYHKLEEELMADRKYLLDAEIENFSDSYIWLRFLNQGTESEILESRIHSDIEDSPCRCLSGVLEAGLRNSIPTDVRLHGLAIDRIGTQFRFCISGSVSLEELQKICEWFPLSDGSTNGR